MNLSELIPELGLSLASYTGKEILRRLGMEMIRETVCGTLCGVNIRALTESLTRRRILLSNLSMLAFQLRLGNEKLDFTELFRDKYGEASANEKLYLQWLVGLTQKGIQNIIRNDASEIDIYLHKLRENIGVLEREVEKEFGNVGGNIRVGDLKLDIDVDFLLRLFLSLGSQTLAIRGSEKSMYGKLFEKLILGSMLTTIGFKPATDTDDSENIFWLSDKTEKRESDATLLLSLGKGVRFDIGFIGSGNPEISLDKASRFDKHKTYKQKEYFMTTFIVVDRIGENSRIIELAKEIDGVMIQMSMTNWVYQIAREIYERHGYRSQILDFRPEASTAFIREKMKDVNLEQFV